MLRYYPDTGRVTIADTSESGSPLIFDTNDGLLSVNPSDVKIGSYRIDTAYTASSRGQDSSISTVDINIDHYISDVTPGATVVRGLLRTVWDSGPQPLDSLWRSASGSHLDILAAVGSTTKPQTSSGTARMATMGFFSFFVASNKLYLNERLVMRAQDPGGPPAISITRPKLTVYYRLLVGSFAV
ncbi:hypothetical protein [Hyphomicrobium sp. ghe19]|uniref:hypothetical protein n=1 Tax=Hyphomicrobium sp. ghe19 TaxID=2682968 RepID=UPI001367533A|nr:hypothetical protein HYPP_03759 [Hyphomicrobium sp. ghe19]